jgi:hypothetical protein
MPVRNAYGAVAEIRIGGELQSDAMTVIALFLNVL